MTRPRNRRPRGGDVGQATPLAALALVLAAGAALALGHLGRTAVGSAAARTAADAAALAGAAAGRPAAEEVARENGAVLVDWSVGPDEVVEVTIRRDGFESSASAAPVPSCVDVGEGTVLC